MIHRFPVRASVLIFCVFLNAVIALGQDPSAGPNLAAQVVDPTASLKTYTFQNRFSPSIWGLDDKENEVNFQAGIAHEMFRTQNIFRITVPYITSNPAGQRGLSDVSIFNVVLYPRAWGTFAIGGVATIGTNKGPGVNTFGMGPAIGAVLKKGKWTYGVFSQNVFSFGDIATSQIQPILAYTVNEKVSFAIGDAQHTIDWNKGRFVNVPLSAQANYIVHLRQQPLRLFVNPQYNVVNEPGTRKWMIAGGISFIVK